MDRTGYRFYDPVQLLGLSEYGYTIMQIWQIPIDLSNV